MPGLSWRQKRTKDDVSPIPTAGAASSSITSDLAPSAETTLSSRNKVAPSPPLPVEKWGLFILHDQPEDMPGVIDIIAIHGINGHYAKTWTGVSTNGQQVNWLKDFLPNKIPPARIFSYGYNSAVQFSKSTGSIIDFADQLLDDIVVCRLSQIERTRPLLFICHGMGGLVFKKALSRAYECGNWRQLREYILGVAFFSTPHQGSGIASLVGSFAATLKAMGFGIHTNAALLKDLDRGSTNLRQISRSFVDYGKNLKILSFYESDKMKGLNFKVVEEYSAVLDLPNEIAISIQGDHRSVCRFIHADEQRFRLVWTNLKSMMEQVLVEQQKAQMRTTLLTANEEHFYNSLKLSDYESYKERSPARVAGTCEWLLDHKQYRAWEQEQQSTLLWLSADPGSGKSVLMSYLVDHLRARNSMAVANIMGDNPPSPPPSIVCHFFFKEDNTQQQSATYALCAILHQIYTAQPKLISFAARRLMLSHTPAAIQDFTSLWRLFIATMEDNRSQDITIIIDALDECDVISRKKLCSNLCQLYLQNLQLPPKRPFLKIIISSRPENCIKAAFTRLPMIRLRGENEHTAIGKDVESVILSSLKDLETNDLSEDLLSTIRTRLVENAEQTFLWIAIMIRLLKDAITEGASQKDINAISATHEISAVYDQLLQKSADISAAEKILSILLAAKRPLLLDELNCALAADDNSVQSIEDVENNLKHPFENYIKSVCGNFLRITRSEVYFVHQTAREYLLSKSRISANLNTANLSSVTHVFDNVTMNRHILHICLRSMFVLSSNAELESQRRNDFTPIYSKGHNFQFYAGVEWRWHLLRVMQSSKDALSVWYINHCKPAFLSFDIVSQTIDIDAINMLYHRQSLIFQLQTYSLFKLFRIMAQLEHGAKAGSLTEMHFISDIKNQLCKVSPYVAPQGEEIEIPQEAGKPAIIWSFSESGEMKLVPRAQSSTVQTS